MLKRKITIPLAAQPIRKLVRADKNGKLMGTGAVIEIPRTYVHFPRRCLCNEASLTSIHRSFTRHNMMANDSVVRVAARFANKHLLNYH
jgi:hypothetical protein